MEFLDGLRALAALYVVFDHEFSSIWFATGHRYNSATFRWTQWLAYGHFAVDLFIVLSGFCLMLPVVRGDGNLRGGVWRFFQRRARRILPPYYLALGFSLVLATTLLRFKTGNNWDSNIPVTPMGVLTHLLLVHDLYASQQINGVFWSIAVEWQIYFVFPLLVLSWNRLGVVPTTVLGCLAGLGGYLAVRHVPLFYGLGGVTPQYLGLFTLGLFGATVCFSPKAPWPALRPRFPWKIIAAALAAAFFAVCHVRGFEWVIFEHVGYMDFLARALAVSVIAVVAGPGAPWLSRLLNGRPLLFVGAFSYSLYLVHGPIVQLVWQYGLRPLHLGDAETFWMLVLLATPLSVGFAYVFFLFCEKPFMSRRLRAAQVQELNPSIPSSGPSAEELVASPEPS